MKAMHPTKDSRVLDVGVEDGGSGDPGIFGAANFFEELYPWPENITAVALHEGERFRERYPDVAYVRADACALPFEDGSFGLYFSNAVIEHVGGRDRQRAFVAEALRVAERVFITTPNRWFPVEVHTGLPVVHWLPPVTADRLYERVGKPWAKEIRLLTPATFRALFPPSAQPRIVNLGMTLAAIASERA